MSTDKFKLSCVLHGHSLDVRSVAVTNKNCLISGSRDKTCKFWRPNTLNSGFTEVFSYKGHSNFVSSVFFLEPSAEFPDGLVITGGNDSNICIYSTDSEEICIKTKGHDNTICCISQGNNPNTFLTSSWDCTAKLWQIVNATVKELMVFKFHQLAVWSVIHLPNGNVVTASADKNIVVWLRNGQVFKILKGHTDCVRDLACFPNYFVSVSNDACVKLWTFDGENLDTFYGHNNYIYSICVNKAFGEDCFVTCGEDRVVKFWKDGEATETITLPAQSVWSVTCMSNGDIVTGSSDGMVRVFTTDPKRYADEDTLKLFEEEVAHLDIAASKEIGGYKISDLPGKEILLQAGKSDGQTKLVREGSNVMCYAWSAAECQWNKIGDVLGASGGTQATSGKTLFEGKEYDFVFSVDIEDDKPPLKLPYNKGQDPWEAAQQFIDRNNLSQMFLDQVANFIVKNSGATVIQQTSDEQNQYVDPFTGGSRYLPGNSVGNDSTRSGSNLDPFTGGSSYTTSTNTSEGPVQMSLDITPDPFTGSDSYKTSSTRVAGKQSYFPQLTYLKFEQGNVAVILDKLHEFNKTLSDESLRVTDEQLENIASLANSDYTSITSIHILTQKLINWPADLLFPVLDIIRLCIRHSQNNFILCSENYGEPLLKVLRVHLVRNVAANRMLALRILSNMFLHSLGEKLILSNIEALLINISAIEDSLNKNTQIALCTFLLNSTICFVKSQNRASILSIVELTAKVLLEINDLEAIFRGYVALGTALSQFNLTGDSINTNALQKLKEKLSAITYFESENATEARNMKCVEELKLLL